MSEREFNVLFPCAGSEPKGEVQPTAPQLLNRLSRQNRLDEIGRSD